MNNLLELKDVTLKYQTDFDEICAIKNLSFSVQENSFVSIVGPSGCGKTTILSLIANLIEKTSGEIIFNADKNSIGYMLQKDQLFPWRNTIENVLLPLEVKHIKNEKNKEYAISLLKKYGLGDFLNHYPSQLSGGMRQRVALIRTLVFNPKLLLLDEPFSALDYQTRLNLCDDVYKIIKQEKKTTILVTHDISEAISMSDKIIVLSSRPSTVKKVFYPDIVGRTPLIRREKKEFSILFEEIYKELNK